MVRKRPTTRSGVWFPVDLVCRKARKAEANTGATSSDSRLIALKAARFDGFVERWLGGQFPAAAASLERRGGMGSRGGQPSGERTYAYRRPFHKVTSLDAGAVDMARGWEAGGEKCERCERRERQALVRIVRRWGHDETRGCRPVAFFRADRDDLAWKEAGKAGGHTWKEALQSFASDVGKVARAAEGPAVLTCC